MSLNQELLGKGKKKYRNEPYCLYLTKKIEPYLLHSLFRWSWILIKYEYILWVFEFAYQLGTYV